MRSPRAAPAATERHTAAAISTSASALVVASSTARPATALEPLNEPDSSLDVTQLRSQQLDAVANVAILQRDLDLLRNHLAVVPILLPENRERSLRPGPSTSIIFLVVVVRVREHVHQGAVIFFFDFFLPIRTSIRHGVGGFTTNPSSSALHPHYPLRLAVRFTSPFLSLPSSFCLLSEIQPSGTLCQPWHMV